MASNPLFGGYRSQLEPQRTATALPTATPEDYGAGIGEALQGVGNVAAQNAIRQRRLEAEQEYDRQLMAAQLDMSQRQAEFETLKNEDRQNGDRPGAQGHTAAMTQWLDKAGQELLGGIQHEGLRQKFAARWGDWRSNRIVDADVFERVSGARLAIEQDKAQEEIMGNRAATMNPAEFEELLQEIATDEKPYAVSADVWTARRREKAKTVSASYIGGLPPDIRLATLDSGMFDLILSPDEKDQLRRGGKIELRAEEMAREEAAQDARVAAREQIAQIEARQARGEAVPAKEAQAAIAAAQAAGVPGSELIRFQTDFEDNATLDGAYSEREDPTGERSARRAAAIAAKPESERTPWERRSYEKLVQRADARAVDQASLLKDAYNSGPAGRLQAAGQILALPNRERQYAVAEAVAPGFGDVVMLGSRDLIANATEGAAILKDRPELLKDRTGKDNSSKEFAAIVGGVGRGLGEQYGSKLEVAKSLYASWAARTGAATFDKAAFEKYVSVAFGGTVRRDGSMQGGLGTVNRHRVVLPDQLTQPEFDRTIARTDWSRARDQGGKPVSRAFIIGRMHPVRVGETDGSMIYNMVDDAGRALFGADRKPLPFVVPKAIR